MLVEVNGLVALLRSAGSKKKGTECLLHISMRVWMEDSDKFPSQIIISLFARSASFDRRYSLTLFNIINLYA